jgi:hypothetical protein
MANTQIKSKNKDKRKRKTNTTFDPYTRKHLKGKATIRAEGTIYTHTEITITYGNDYSRRDHFKGPMNIPPIIISTPPNPKQIKHGSMEHLFVTPKTKLTPAKRKTTTTHPQTSKKITPNKDAHIPTHISPSEDKANKYSTDEIDQQLKQPMGEIQHHNDTEIIETLNRTNIKRPLPRYTKPHDDTETERTTIQSIHEQPDTHENSTDTNQYNNNTHEPSHDDAEIIHILDYTVTEHKTQNINPLHILEATRKQHQSTHTNTQSFECDIDDDPLNDEFEYFPDYDTDNEPPIDKTSTTNEHSQQKNTEKKQNITSQLPSVIASPLTLPNPINMTQEQTQHNTSIQQHIFQPPPLQSIDDTATPIGIIAYSSLFTKDNRKVLFIDETLCTKKEAGVSKTLIATAMNNIQDALEIHCICRSNAEQQNNARTLWKSLGMTITHDISKRVHIGGHALQTKSSNDNTELAQDYWIATRETLSDNMQLSYWSAPLISRYYPHDKNTNAKILSLLLYTAFHHMEEAGDKADVFSILSTADQILIAYEDPMIPLHPKASTKQMILPYKKDTTTSTPIQTQSTIMSVRETFKKMSSDPCTIMRERAAIGIPNIIHRIHKFKRHELKHIITRGKKIKKKKKGKKHTSFDTTQHYLPTRRNPITSRWSSKSKKNYTKMLFSSYTPIT